MKIAMVGNPNVGKTALLNALTGGRFEVGNFPGTTVEKKEGCLKLNGKEVVIVDLPGVYSLDAQTPDEEVTRDYIVKERPNLILNVLNASNLERNLYLTLQLTKFRIPMIVVLNMVDEARRRGIRINSKALSEILGVPVVETVAVKGIGIDRLKREIELGGRVPRIEVGEDLRERVRVAEEIVKEVVRAEREVRDYTEALDEVFMDKHLGIPIFLSLMWIMFKLTYTVVDPLTGWIKDAFDAVAAFISSYSPLLGDGVVKGVGSVLQYVPNIVMLFVVLSILELSGYMPRAVYLLDRLVSSFGLTGRSVIPLIMGFGCNVPAVMATRAIEDERVRIATAVVNPFISCSARLPIYLMLASIFFPRIGSVVIMFLYVFGLFTALFSALMIRKTLLRGEAEYLIELPPYRIPNPRDVMILTWNRTKHFLQKAGTIILGMSVVLWYIMNYPKPGAGSYAAIIGKTIAPLFSPLGWGWKLVLSLILGMVAKEVVVETLTMLNVPLSTVLTPSQALSFMVFTLLYMPCLATLATIRAEVGTKWAAFSVIYSLTVAYILSLIVGVIARSVFFTP